MCGIAGLVGLPKDKAKSIVSQMIQSMAHRGPDAEGIISNEKICLGHRRLSIIDCDPRSNQPFIDSSGRYSIVFNGEIYNYLELKNQLKHYSFNTASDTEVLLAGYLHWGVNVLSKLNGMFAFAIWDKQEQSLFIARDRLGIKPLYYSLDEGFIFSSEIRPIIKSKLSAYNLNKASVAEFLAYQTVNAPRTIIDNIQQLESGHYGLYKSGKFEKYSYWNTRDLKATEESIEQVKRRVRNALIKSVEYRMIADVPLGAFLSGGIDSSAIVGLMSEISDREIQTFSLGFHEKAFDETHYAELISQRFNTKHESLIVKPSRMVEKIPEVLSCMDFPTADGVNSYLISEATKKSGLVVALSGLGGDELFAGYSVFKQLPKLSGSMLFKLPVSVRKMLAPLLYMKLMPHQRAKMGMLLNSDPKNLSEFYSLFRRITSDFELKQLFGSNQKIPDPIPISSKFNNLTSEISLAELKSYTSNLLLRDTDQMSMSHSLEVRVPFLDHELVEAILPIAEEYKIGSSPKSLLVNSLEDLLPEEIINRPKQGFALPWEVWIRNELKPFIESQLAKLEKFEVLDNSSVSRLWINFLAGDKTIHWSRIWTLAILGHWLDRNL